MLYNKTVMQVDFLTSFISVATMIAIAVPGFILRKKNMLPEKAVAALVAVLIYVSQPFLTIGSFLEKDYRPELLVGMGVTFLLSLVLHTLAYFMAKGTFALFREKKTAEADRENGEELPLASKLAAEKRMLTVTSFMGNVGFMGIPVMKALFPESPEMLIYTAVFILGFNIASWTLGVYEVTGDKKNISFRRALLNPPTAALVVALPLFFFKSYIPPDVIVPVSSAVGYLADMTLPLSMIILGIRLADIKFSSLFTDGKVYVACALKLVASPLLAFAVCFALVRLFPALDRSVSITIYIVMAMPSASLGLTFAEMFDGDRESAVRSTLLTTLFSVITIPLLMLLCAFM